MRAIPAILGAIVVLAIGLIGLVVFLLLPEREPGQPAPIAFQDIEGGAVDSAARIEIERLRQQIETLQQSLGQLENTQAALRARLDALGPDRMGEGAPPADFQRDGPNQIIDAYAQVVLIANRRQVNKGLRVASPSYLESIFGKPRATLSDRCEPMTNERLRAKLVLEDVGPIRVQMQQPAVDSLRRVFEKVKATDPDLYARINTAGSLCVRRIRGSQMRSSTHAFGLSVDLNIDGRLDTLGDGKTQLGLTILADFFINEGWYWGAAFSREDSMHFEVSRDLVETWVQEGKI